MWNEIENLLKATRFALRLELRPTDRNLAEFDYIQAKLPSYFPTVIGAASVAFESVFSPEEQMIMICRRHGGKRVHIRKKDFCFKQIQFDPNVSIHFRKRKEGDRGYWIREALVTGLCRKIINYRNLFLGIAHADFGMVPTIRHANFFVSVERGLVFFMYDDRGLLIASPSQEDLPELPSSLNILKREDLRGTEFLNR